MEKQIVSGCRALIQFGCNKGYSDISSYVGKEVFVEQPCTCIVRVLVSSCNHKIWVVDSKEYTKLCIEECFLLRIDGMDGEKEEDEDIIVPFTLTRIE